MREGGEALPNDSIAILDSSVLIAMGGPSTEQYRRFEQHVTRRNIAVRIPDLVAEELGESPEAYTYHRDRLRAAQEAGWLERAQVDFSNPRVSETVDRTRTRMAKLSADDVREDEIEKIDTVLAVLAYQCVSVLAELEEKVFHDGPAFDEKVCAWMELDDGNEFTYQEGPDADDRVSARVDPEWEGRDVEMLVVSNFVPSYLEK